MTPSRQAGPTVPVATTPCPVVPPWSAILPPGARAADLARTGIEERLCPVHGRYAGPAVARLVEELVDHLTVPGARWVTVALECHVVEVQVEVGVVRSRGALRRAVAADVTWRLVDRLARRWDRHRDGDGESIRCAVPTGVVPERAERSPVVPRQRHPGQTAAGWTASQPA